MTLHEFVVSQGVIRNLGQLKGPVMQLPSLFFSQIKLVGYERHLCIIIGFFPFLFLFFNQRQ
jgi:hypothetical protein